MINVVRWLCDIVRCRKLSHDHGTTSWEGRAGENMWKYGTDFRQVAWRQAMLHDVTGWLYDTLLSRTWPITAETSCEAPRWLRLRMTSHDYARFTQDGTRSLKLRPSQVVVRCTVVAGVTIAYTVCLRHLELPGSLRAQNSSNPWVIVQYTVSARTEFYGFYQPVETPYTRKQPVSESHGLPTILFP